MPKSSFRHNAGFGKQIEYSIIAQMLKEGLDVYVPLVDGKQERIAIDSIPDTAQLLYGDAHRIWDYVR